MKNASVSHVFLFTCSVLSFYQVCVISFTPNMNHFHHSTVTSTYSGSASTSASQFLSKAMSISATRSTTSLRSTLRKEEDENENENPNNSHSNNDPNANTNGIDNQRESEFTSLEPREKTQLHEQRIQEQLHIQNTFVSYGDELWELRSTLLHLSKQLIHTMAQSETEEEVIVSEDELREMIREVEAKDPELVYALELEHFEKALEEDRLDDAKSHKEKALIARSVLPQFNLHGLWVGNYGDKGFEMVNVTYVGDTLIARKVTGDENVPAKEISFQADLSPPKTRHTSFKANNNNHNDMKPKLSNIILSEKASKKWNTKELSRFSGIGQVAEKGFKNSQWMDGQLVFINEDYFSFAWMPINYQILFGRPSYDLTVNMMTEQENATLPKKNTNLLDQEEEDDEEDFYVYHHESHGEECMLPPDADDDIGTLNKHVVNCFDATLQLVDECSLQDDSSSCIFDDGSDACCFE